MHEWVLKGSWLDQEKIHRVVGIDILFYFDKEISPRTLQ